MKIMPLNGIINLHHKCKDIVQKSQFSLKIGTYIYLQLQKFIHKNDVIIFVLRIAKTWSPLPKLTI
jgi:hypothetical protein